MSEQPTLEQLRDRASELDIKDRSKMDKEQLQQAVHDAEEALRARTATETAEFPGTPPAQQGTAPQAQSATTFADDEYSVEQFVAHPSLLNTGRERRRVDGTFIRVALRRAASDRTHWSVPAAQAAVDALLEHPVHKE